MSSPSIYNLNWWFQVSRIYEIFERVQQELILICTHSNHECCLRYRTRTWITLRKYLPLLKAFPTVQSLSYHLSLLWAACKVAKLLLKSKYNLPCSIFDILPYPYSAWKSWLNELINIYIKSFCFDWMSAKFIFTILFILSPIFGILYSTFVSPRVLCRIHQVLF